MGSIEERQVRVRHQEHVLHQLAITNIVNLRQSDEREANDEARRIRIAQDTFRIIASE